MDFSRLPGSRRSRKLGGGLRGLGRPGSPWRLERGMLGIILVTVAVYVATTYVPLLREHLPLVPARLWKRLELWQPLTAVFTSLQVGNLVFDALFIWLMGSFIERAIGTSRAVSLYIVTGVAGYFAAGAIGYALTPARPLGGATPSLFAMMAASGFIYGRQQVLFFGAMPARADVIAWIFCGIWLAWGAITGDFTGVAGNLGAGAAAWAMLRKKGARSIDLGSPIARVRLWWLRRRYKVLDGGKSKNEKRWMN